MPMKIHVVSETQFVMKGQGVHTAFIDHVKLLKEKNDVEVIINGQGRGDIFHSHTYGPYYFWKGRRYKGRRVLTVHVIPDSIKGSIPMWKLFLPFARWYFKRVYNYADVCIAISPMVEQVIKNLGVKSRIVRIYNPIDVDNWKRTSEKRIAGRKLLGVSDNDFVILGVGQLQSRKGVEDFLEVAESIPNAKFVWIGGRPFGLLNERSNKINHLIAKASNHIKFTGMLDLNDMPLVYSAGDCLLFPSYQENCPLAPIEAAASGIPVIFRSLKEYELLYKYPYLKADSNSEFIKLINKLIDDADFYSEGVKLSENLITEFDRNRIREKLINLYKELLKI